jgi:hypothetical protein
VVQPFDTLDEAIAQANALPYGLGAYAFTRDLTPRTAWAKSIEAGMVGINHFGVSQPELPFGGIKESGEGQEMGAEGITGLHRAQDRHRGSPLIGAPMSTRTQARQRAVPVAPDGAPAAMKKSAPDIIARGEGCWVWDVDGHKLLDGVAGLWSSNLGHSCEPVRDAIVAQLDELPFFNTFRGTTHPRAIELSAAPGGADAARRRGRGDVQQRRQRRGGRRAQARAPVPQAARREGPQQVHRAAPGLPRRALRRHERQRQHQLPPRLRAAAARLLPHRQPLALPQRLHRADEAELGRIVAAQLEREIVFQGPDTVAAFIAEPVQGAGGVIVPPANFWPLVREVCDRHGVLLIADEVVTGFGRTGRCSAPGCGA